MTTAVKVDQLLVSRQDPKTRQYVRVGTLAFDGNEYRFTYEPGATRPLPGLPLMEEAHQSPELFPIFAERVMDPRRPERVQTLERLGLNSDVGPIEVLAVSGGGRTGDTYELTPLPHEGSANILFLVHGIRYLDSKEVAVVDQLAIGDELALAAEPENPRNVRALLVTRDRKRLGYVPDPLLDYVHNIIDGEHQLRVERVNPPEAGLHMRLLVRLTGYYSE